MMLVPRVVEVFQKIHHVLFTICQICPNQRLIFLQLSQICYKDSVLFDPDFKGKLREGFKNPSNGNFPLRGGGTPLFR